MHECIFYICIWFLYFCFIIILFYNYIEIFVLLKREIFYDFKRTDYRERFWYNLKRLVELYPDQEDLKETYSEVFDKLQNLTIEKIEDPYEIVIDIIDEKEDHKSCSVKKKIL